ncbi:MAG: type II toxin-antitoxin system VapC family toxin [Planctomycetes bacterium]|nr:type II toxin-antitoxin system VapC family toxin [Planctomycetota bacterium]
MVLDTCALLWRAFEKEKLSNKAVHSILNASVITISSISIWEIGIKVKRKHLEIPISIESLVLRLKEIDRVKITSIDENIWLESLRLKWNHRDPADRVIVATAKLFNMPVVTNDKKMKKFYNNVIW